MRENAIKTNEILGSLCMQNKGFTCFPRFAKRFVCDSSLINYAMSMIMLGLEKYYHFSVRNKHKLTKVSFTTSTTKTCLLKEEVSTTKPYHSLESMNYFIVFNLAFYSYRAHILLSHSYSTTVLLS